MTISGRAKAIELLRAGMDGAHVVVAMVEVGWSKRAYPVNAHIINI